jgi:hypothetical protein
MTEKGGGKLHDIKETASDAVEIMRELATPGVRESLDIIKDTAETAKEIMETMKTPEWERNMENIRMISENINSTSARMDRATKELKDTGIIDDSKDLISAIKSKIGPSSSASSAGSKGQQTAAAAAGGGGIGGQDLKELSVAIKEMLESIKALLEEARIMISESKRSGTLHHAKETYGEARDAYRTVTGGLGKER